MNTIKIYLSSSGSLAELKKDFPLYQGAFNDKLLNVYVPTSLLPGTVDTQYVDETGFVHTEPGVFTALKIGMVSIGRDGRINKTNAFYMRYLKKLMYQGIEYALYERALPQAFTLFEGQNSQAPKLIINVVNMENNNEYSGEEIILGEPKILQVITSQQCSLDVLPSTSFDRDALIEPSEWEIVDGKINDLYEKYDYIVNNIDETIANYTYSKAVIDQKDADTLQLAKDYADENFYDETESDARFVHLTGNETIGGTKTFSASPIVPTPSANTHAVNRKYVTDNFYDKEQIGNLTSPISFSIEQNFMDWLAGEYIRPDGILPQDLLLGKKVIIQETGKNNYQVAYVPALSIECYKILVEDNKYASEIGFSPYKDITATDTQEAVEQVKDQVDLKAQIIELEDLTIEITEWIDDSGDIYFDYENENFTDPTKQFFEFVSNDKDQNEAIANEGFSVLAVDTVVVGGVYKVRLSANKVPSIDIVLNVNLINYTNEVFEAGEITANKIIYSNTTSGLIATEVQSAIDELVSTKQDELVSGVNIKTVNNTSLLGSGDITISGIDYLKDPDKTYLVIKIPADNDTFELLTGENGSPNYVIDWGDGQSENITTTDNPSHEYEKEGMYLITISGAFSNGIQYGIGLNETKIIEVYGGSNYPLVIGPYDFHGCTSLTTANFPSATSIQLYAFNGCTSLTTANFPNATSIDTLAFANCTSLTTVNFPSATSVGGNAFVNCTSLTTANFPNATSVGQSAFNGCTSLTTVNLPNATSIGGNAFVNCTSLTTANFPNATSVGIYVFHNCTSLTIVNFPSATSIESGVFANCTSLTTANFPSATSVDTDAFEDCSSLKELTLGNVITTATGTRFDNVKLINLKIAQDVTNTDIDRIKLFYADNGGTFTGAQINSI